MVKIAIEKYSKNLYRGIGIVNGLPIIIFGSSFMNVITKALYEYMKRRAFFTEEC